MADKPLIDDLINIQNALASPQATAEMNLARQRGNSLADNQVLMDRQTMTPFEFYSKYGNQVSQNIDRLDIGAANLRRFSDVERNVPTRLSDSLEGIAAGLTQSLGGVASAGALATLPVGFDQNKSFNIDTALKVGQLTNAVTEDIRSKQSEELQRTRVLDSMRANLDKQDTVKENDGSLLGGLKQIGKDALNAAGRFVEDPNTFESGVSEGIGSLFAAGPVAKVTAGSVPLAIGVMEGGGAFNQTATDILDKSHADLMKNSPDYRELIMSGASIEEAKNQIAGRAGITAGAIQAPISALTGKLVERFEAAPLTVPTLRQLGSNAVREATEEGIQSATGQLSQNIGTKLYADQNQSLIEDVGSQAAQGAILGAASASVVQTPGATLGTVAKGLTSAGRAITERGERIINDNNAAKPNSEEKVQKAVNVATEQAPVVAESLRTLATEAKAPVEDTESFIQRVSQATQITPAEIANLPVQLQETIPDDGNRFSALAQMARTAGNEDVSQADRISAAVFLLDQLDNNKKLFNEDIPEFLDKIPHDREEYQQFEQYRNIINAIENVPSIQEALKWANEKMKMEPTEEINNQTVNNLIGISKYTPQAISPEIADRVLLQADTGSVDLTPENRQIIQNASSLVKAGNTYNQVLDTINPELSGTDIVNQQIETTGGLKPYQYSMEQHVRRINEALARNDQKTARERMTDLQLFARHMRNKYEAAINSYNNNGKSESYRTLGADHKWIPDESKWSTIRIYPTKQNSINLAQQIYAESVALSELANNIANSNPQFGFKPITVNPIPSLVLKEDVSRQLEPNETNTVEQNQPQEITDDKSQQVAVESVNVESTPEVTNAVSEAPETVSEPQLEQTKSDLPNDGGSGITDLAQKNISEPSEENNKKQTAPNKDSNSVVQDNTPNYDKLVEPKGKNYFKTAYKLPKKAISRLVQLSNPIKDINNLIEDDAARIEFVGSDVDYNLTTENKDAVQSFLALGVDARKEIVSRLKKYFATDTDKSGKTLLERLKDGEEITRYVRGRMLNLLDNSGTRIGYNPQLLESAILAGLDWSLNSQQRFNALDKSEIADLFGVNENDVTAQDVREFNRGISADAAKRELAQNIIRFWGVNTNSNEAQAYTKGIAEGIAAEVLYGLQAAGLVEIGSIGTKDKTFNRVWFDTRSDNINQLIGSMGAGSNLFSDIALVQKTKAIHIGKPPVEVAKKQLRSPMVDNTRQQRQVIEKAQNTPYYTNESVHDFIKAMGMKNFVLLMGGEDYNIDELNVNYEASVEGKNRTLINSFNNILNQVEQTKAYATKQNMKLEDVPTYYEFNISRVGRLQMQGLNNPQSDKLAREIFMPTKTVLDMTDPIGSDAKKFWMTVGQGIGLKTEKLTRNQVMEAAIKDTMNPDSKFRPAVESILSWLNDRTKPLPDGLIEGLMGQGLTMHGVHSLIAVAQYEKAFKEGKLKDFTHYNYLEADGKTNGPINSLMLMTTGRFTPEWLKLVAKGGMFVGSRNKTLADHIQNEDGADLYEEVKDVFSKNQKDFLDYINRTNPQAVDQFIKLLKFMSALNADIDFNPDTNELTMKRGVTKNPLTISIYGSGADGIAANITNELMDTIYERITEGDLFNNSFSQQDLIDLVSVMPSVDRRTGNISFIEAKGSTQGGKSNSNRDFTFSERQFNALKGNIRVFFVNQMRDAIQNGVMGNVSDATTAVQEATQIQSIILKAMFDNEVFARLYEKEVNKPNGYRKGDFLSDNEINQIYSDLTAYSPIIDTGTQKFFLAGSESSDLSGSVEVNGIKINIPESFSRALDDTLSSPVYLYKPTEAGVRGVPSLVIGTGDGQMIQNIIGKYDVKGLPVFDGFNMNAKDIDTYGERINKAVYDTWNENPLQKVADSFKEFVRNNPLESLLKDNPLNTQKKYLIEAISKTALGQRNPKNLIAEKDIQPYLEAISAKLDRLAEEVSVRQAVLKQVDLSIDQMASAEAPYTQKGTSISGSLDQVADELNRLYDIELQKRKSIPEPIQKEQPQLVEAVNNIATSFDNVKVINVNNLDQIINVLDLVPIHKEMMTNTLKALSDSGYQVVIGSPDELANYRANNYPDRNIGNIDHYGLTDFETKTIYVANVSPETLAHELIHAATFNKVNDYYNNRNNLSQVDQDAVARIEGLMNEWLLQNYSVEDTATQEARRQALSTISSYLNQDRPAEALNEFMAWSLANQNLAKVMSKTKVKNPLYKILENAYVYIKRLIWGTKFAISVNDSLFSNLRFNTRILLATPSRSDSLISDMGSVALYQSPSFGTNNYISELTDKFTKKLGQYVINGSAFEKDARNDKANEAMRRGAEVAREFAARGFHMDMQTISAFGMIQAVLMTEAELNTDSLTRLQDMYAHVMKNINVEDFMVNPEKDNPNDRFQAQEKYNVLNGVYLTVNDTQDRSSLMSSFLALAMVDEGFRKILSGIKKPVIEKDNEGTLDSILRNMGNEAMDRLAAYMAGDGRKNKNAKASIDALVNNLIDNVGDRRAFIEQKYGDYIDGVDKYLKDNINYLSDKAYNKSNDIINNSNNPLVVAPAKLVRFASTLINENKASLAVQGVVSALNQGDGFVTLREFVNEMVGRTKENANVFDMISKVRAEIQQVRQQFREDLPELIKSKFSKTLSNRELSDMFYGFGKTDLASLYGSLGIQGMMDVISDTKKLDKTISNLENSIKSVEPTRFNMIKQKAEQLADFMIDGQHGPNLLRNAYAVAHLFGEKGLARKGGQAVGIVDQVDNLISLYAIKALDPDIINNLNNLIQNENDGVKFTLSYLVGERNDELSKINSDITRVNHYKGYIPSESQLGVSLIVARESERNKLISLGYKEGSVYVGSSADTDTTLKRYYFAPVSGRATYNQGVLQTVHQTASGIDPRTGYSIDLTAGRIDDPKWINIIKRRLNNQRNTNENLLPIYDDQGNVTAYERGIDPRQLTKLNKNTDLSQMMGAWRGRQVEEALAKEFNNQLVDNLYNIWNQGKKDKRSNEFIDLSKSTDPIHKDTWKIIPQDVKDYIRTTYGNDGFRIRRDMINDAVGFRQASIGDLWTGNTRWKPAVASEIQKFLAGFFGKRIYSYLDENAFTALVKGENFVQNLVSDAKVLIVVKSVIVPAANIISNIYQLLNEGVPIRNVLSGLGSKTTEINDYIKRRDKEIKLEADLLAAKGANNNVQIRKLETEIQSIKDSYKRMSIYPLIEAGEFSAISDGGVTQEDLALANGRWVSFVEGIANKLPDGLKTTYRYALITRDTALFQGLTRATQYGDFIAKAILYDDLVKRKKVSKSEALAQISEEFINYNRLAGRSRNYLESMGLLWFWNYKLRIMKIGVSMVRNHPFRSLMMSVAAPSLPVIGNIGSPISDNFLTVLADGRLGYSIGPGMGLNSLNLNPWVNIVK